MALSEAIRSAVRARMGANDASHDFAHVERVRVLALRLAAEEGVTDAATLQVIELAALLHDVNDYKYVPVEGGSTDPVADILAANGIDANTSERICTIIDGVSFSGELGSKAVTLPIETAVVQDADRLEAIGAIGIARCLTFGAARGRTLYDPTIEPVVGLTKEEYRSRKSTTINHFHEKLFLLKGMMKTKAGLALAEHRHAYMESFLAEFVAEWNGER